MLTKNFLHKQFFFLRSSNCQLFIRFPLSHFFFFFKRYERSFNANIMAAVKKPQHIGVRYFKMIMRLSKRIFSGFEWKAKTKELLVFPVWCLVSASSQHYLVKQQLHDCKIKYRLFLHCTTYSNYTLSICKLWESKHICSYYLFIQISIILSHVIPKCFSIISQEH